MAKRICPFCKEKVKENATICKHCGSKLPALPPKKWYQTWKGLLLVLFLLGIIAQTFKEQPTSPPSQSSSAPPPSVISEKKTAKKNNSGIDERKALQDSYFGNFSNAKIQKKSGKITLNVWRPWVLYVQEKLPPVAQDAFLVGPQRLIVEYDEIWIAEVDEFLTESEKRKWKGQLDILKLYWKEGKVQASTVEKFYFGNPLTHKKLSHPAHKITDIHDRSFILKKLQEN